MKTKGSILIVMFIGTLLFISVGNALVYPQKGKEPYFSQVVTTPDKTLNFNIFVLLSSFKLSILSYGHLANLWYNL